MLTFGALNNPRGIGTKQAADLCQMQVPPPNQARMLLAASDAAAALQGCRFGVQERRRCQSEPVSVRRAQPDRLQRGHTYKKIQWSWNTSSPAEQHLAPCQYKILLKASCRIRKKRVSSMARQSPWSSLVTQKGEECSGKLPWATLTVHGQQR